MDLMESIRQEFDHEAKTTRRHLERIPEEKLTWKPHQKSFSAAALASHLVECIGWGESIFSEDEASLDPATYKPLHVKSSANLLQTFDENVANCKRALDAASAEDLDRSWRFKWGGQVVFDRPKALAFRDFTLSHIIHHRGQLSVYLRLLEVPVPGSYGPTADEA